MKALLDQNLSFRLVEVLLPRFPGRLHVRDVDLTGDDDERIWALAKNEGFVIVTKDNDFLARALVRGHPPQIVHICLGNASPPGDSPPLEGSHGRYRAIRRGEQGVGVPAARIIAPSR